MNNKRVTFYFISLIILMSLFVIFVWAGSGESMDISQGLYNIVINNVTSGSNLLNRFNVTTGENLNFTCTAQRSNNGSLPLNGSAAIITNVSFYHNFNSTYVGLNITSTYDVVNSSNNSISVLQVNASNTSNSVRFRAINGSMSFDSNGVASFPTIASVSEGNYSIACAAATNNTGTFNFSTNVTLAIDRSRPNFSISTLNVTDGTNVVDLGLLNATDGGDKAYLRNDSTLIVSVSVTEPYPDSARLFWSTNVTIPEVNLSPNINNLSMNRKVSPSASQNVSVYNGSLRYAGVSADIIDRGLLADGTVINFKMIANDSAGNIRNFTNGGAGFNITLDGTVPRVTYSIDKTRIETLQSVKATCEANDTSPVSFRITLTKPSGATVVKTPLDGKATFSDKDTGEAGKYTIVCRVEDKVKYVTEETKEFSAFYGGEDSGTTLTEEEEEKPVAQIDLSKRTTEAPVEAGVSGIQGESKSFTLDGETPHTITFLEVDAQEVTLRFESTPVDVTLRVGETKEVDLDADGKNDVIVTLRGVADETVDVLIKPVVQPPIQETTPTETPTTSETTEQSTSRTGVVVLVIVIAAVLVVAYLVLKKGKKGKKGEIRFTSKDLSSEFSF